MEKTTEERAVEILEDLATHVIKMREKGASMEQDATILGMYVLAKTALDLGTAVRSALSSLPFPGMSTTPPVPTDDPEEGPVPSGLTPEEIREILEANKDR